MYMADLVSHEINELAIRTYRLKRTRDQRSKHNIAGAILTDPVNIRYATGSRNMQIWTSRNLVRYAFVPAEGPVVLFEDGNAFHLSKDLETVSEIRGATSLEYGILGDRFDQQAGQWADEIIDLFPKTCGRDGRLGIDTGSHMGILAMQARGI